MKSNNNSIAEVLQSFYDSFPYLDIDGLVEFFSFFGGVEESVELDIFGGIEATIEKQIVDNFDNSKLLISPSYLRDAPYRKLLISVARGDGKIFNVLKRSRLSESVGGEIIGELTKLGILTIEESREAPRQRKQGEDLPKEFRGYRIQPKVRFVDPFYRFWFGFVEPYAAELESGDLDRFWENFENHRDRAQSLVFEHLSNALLVDIFSGTDAIISYGSWWNRRSEYDLLSLTESGKLILGECKYKGRKITKRELTKLKDKALHTGIRVDIFALFSRNGFSRELQSMKSDELMLFDISDYKRLIRP